MARMLWRWQLWRWAVLRYVSARLLGFEWLARWSGACAALMALFRRSGDWAMVAECRERCGSCRHECEENPAMF